MTETVQIFKDLLCFSIIVLSCDSGNCFNIDIKQHVKFSGDAESYFGYSIALAGNKWVITGAPRANSTDLPSINSPGALYRCYISDNKPLCEEIHIDGKRASDSAMFDGKLIWFSHGRKGQWLGGSLNLKDTATGWEIVTCAPRWYNRKFESLGEYDMNGFCYLIPSDLQVANIRKIPAMVGASKRTAETSWGQKIYNFGMAAMGFSLHVTKEKQKVLIGAPGMKHWTGGFIEMEGNSVKYMESNLDSINDTQDSYIGFAMTSGRYFSDRQIYFAVGAPRANLIGKVLMFKSDADDFSLEQAESQIIPQMNGENGNAPMNSYFGATLCSADVNGDGFDDLLVGAPLHTNKPSEYDVGACFLYLGTTQTHGNKFGVPDMYMRGSGTSGARFGSAIASLGDLNADGFNDILVGAPYDDAGRGSVYIYNGYADGIWPKHSLKIIGRNVEDGLFGFGASFSNAMDMNRDNINDIAVGAYGSDNVVLLFGQPVIRMNAWIEISVGDKAIARQDVAMIERATNDISIKTCFRFTDSIDTQSLTLNVTVTLDSEFNSKPRLLFKSSNSEERHLTVKVWRGDTICTVPQENDIAYVQSTADLVTPVVVKATYKAENVQYYGDGVEPTINKFNGNSPKDPVLEVKREIHFLKDCDNNTCTTDLHLRAQLDFKSIDGYFIVGYQHLALHINVTKDGDPSYGSAFHLTFPGFLRYRKTEQLTSSTDFSCFTETVEERQKCKLLICNIGNPVYNDSGVEFRVVLQVPIELPNSELTFRMNVTTLSYETNLYDNQREFNIVPIHHVQASVLGISNPTTMIINKHQDNFVAQHVYEFANAGPSPLSNATVKFFYPAVKPGEDFRTSLYLNETKFKLPEATGLKCVVHQTASSPSVYVWTNEEQTGVMRQHNVSDFQLDNKMCLSKPCSYIECTIKHVPARTTIVTALVFVINKDAMEGETRSLLSKMHVELDEQGLISTRLNFEKQLTTELLPETPPKKEVDTWVIVISVLVGVLLLVILMVILFKMGFFKRQLRDELVRQKSVRSTFSQRNGTDHGEKTCNNATENSTEEILDKGKEANTPD